MHVNGLYGWCMSMNFQPHFFYHGTL
jgi:hypothetical protein